MQEEMINLHLHAHCGALSNSTRESYPTEQIYVSRSVAWSQTYGYYIKF